MTQPVKKEPKLKVPKAPKNNTVPKRNRVPISCTICRRRKVKCDKKRPVCTSCDTNGVSHLCHYVDPIWAQPLNEAEIQTPAVSSREQTESDPETISKLKEKIKSLESQLRIQNNGSSSSSTISDTSPTFSENSPGKVHNDKPMANVFENLKLSKTFDMLHMKATTTVHLGATSWLAIMKGDPYLRVLWAHIFKLRKQAEERKFKKKMDLHHSREPSSVPRSPDEPIKLAIRHLNNEITPPVPKMEGLSGIKCPVSGKDLSQGKCPVIHAAGRCPVKYQLETENPIEQSDTNVVAESPHISSPSPPTPSSPQKESPDKAATSLYDPQTCPVSGKGTSQGVCPVAHDLQDEQIKKLEEEVAIEQVNLQRSAEQEQLFLEKESKMDDNKVCPLMIGDNSFLEKDEPQLEEEKLAETDQQPPIKRRKRSSSSQNKKAGIPKRADVTPEDFKKNPVAMMQEFLPPKKALWLLIDRFFEVLYIYMPFVDEQSFREEARFIFGESDDEEQKITIKIRSGIDFAVIGTVCIILRLTWNTLPMNNINLTLKSSSNLKTYSENKETIKFLERPENEVPIELVDCVKHCFSNLKLMRKSSLKIVQCALFMKLYFIFSPQDGDGADGSDSQIFLGMIIQMAISIGLHRDPKNFENFSNERQRHLWRKIWFELISLDITQSMNLGCPRSLKNYEEFSDTKLPGETEDGLDLEEFKDDLKELTVIRNIHTKFDIDKLISKTMNVLLNLNDPATRTQVDELIEELQKSISGFTKSTDKYTLPQLGKILVHRTKAEPLISSATRAIEFRLHVVVNMMIYLLNYILFVHFEPKASQFPQASTIAKTYAQRALDCALNGYKNCTLFFDTGLEFFGPGVDLVLSPLLLLIGHRSIQFMVSLILRSRCAPFMKPSLSENRNQSTVNPKSFLGALDVKNGFHIIDNRNHDLNSVNIVGDSDEFKSVFNVDVNSGEILSSILLEHMDNFYKLANKLGKKYSYSWRMSKAVGFFITLLKKPINVIKNLVKTENVKDVESNTGHVSNLLNSIPLALSNDEENSIRIPTFFSSIEETPVESPIPLSGNLKNYVQSPFNIQNSTLDTPSATDTNFATGSDYAPTTGQATTPNAFSSLSLSFTDKNIYETISNNPINTVDVDSDSGGPFPELMQATDSYDMFSDEKTFSDLFGILSDSGANKPGSKNEAGNGAGLASEMDSSAGFDSMMGSTWFS